VDQIEQEVLADDFAGHTPGPWEVRFDCGASRYIAERGKLPHANVWGRSEQSPETTLADARLTAAAPRLLRERDEARAENATLREAREEAEDAYDSLAHKHLQLVDENAKLLC
jgi:hypothetical protein